MKRTCPNCNQPIKEDSLYFCLSCGHKLGEELLKRDHPFKLKVLKFSPEKIKGEKRGFNIKDIHLSKKLLVGFSFVLLAGLFSIGAILFTMSKAKKTAESQAPAQEEVVQEVIYPNSRDLDLPQSNINLADEDYTKYIPYGNYFYILGSDAVGFHSSFFANVSGESILSDLEDFIEGKFILIGGKEEEAWHLTSVLYLKDDESADETFEDVVKEGWYIQKLGDVLVLSQKEEMLTEVAEASEGISKNISHHPKFRIETTNVPKEGQLLYINLDSSVNPLQEMIEIYSPAHDLIESIKDINALDPTKFVIRNNRE